MTLNDDEIPRHEIVRAGIGRTFQHVRLIPQMSVIDNVALGAKAIEVEGVAKATAAPSRISAASRY